MDDCRCGLCTTIQAGQFRIMLSGSEYGQPRNGEVVEILRVVKSSNHPGTHDIPDAVVVRGLVARREIETHRFCIGRLATESEVLGAIAVDRGMSE